MTRRELVVNNRHGSGSTIAVPLVGMPKKEDGGAAEVAVPAGTVCGVCGLQPEGPVAAPCCGCVACGECLAMRGRRAAALRTHH